LLGNESIPRCQRDNQSDSSNPLDHNVEPELATVVDVVDEGAVVDVDDVVDDVAVDGTVVVDDSPPAVPPEPPPVPPEPPPVPPEPPPEPPVPLASVAGAVVLVVVAPDAEDFAAPRPRNADVVRSVCSAA
jgi:hypothetical protein